MALKEINKETYCKTCTYGPKPWDCVKKTQCNMINLKPSEYIDANTCEVCVTQSLPNNYTHPEDDLVNNPNHYCSGGIEPIDFIEAKGLGFCLGNVVKYVARAGKKKELNMTDAEKAIQDLEKARWYLNRAITEIENGQAEIVTQRS